MSEQDKFDVVDELISDAIQEAIELRLSKEQIKERLRLALNDVDNAYDKED